MPSSHQHWMLKKWQIVPPLIVWSNWPSWQAAPPFRQLTASLDHGRPSVVSIRRWDERQDRTGSQFYGGWAIGRGWRRSGRGLGLLGGCLLCTWLVMFRRIDSRGGSSRVVLFVLSVIAVKMCIAIMLCMQHYFQCSCIFIYFYPKIFEPVRSWEPLRLLCRMWHFLHSHIPSNSACSAYVF